MNRRPLPGVLPLVRALAAGQTDFDISLLEASVVRRALNTGLGPILTYVGVASGARMRPQMLAPYADSIRAADLTARLVAADRYALLEQILSAAASVGCRPVLLKGAATSLRYYAAPHLRAMGDVDLLVPADCQQPLARELRQLGFRQQSHLPPEAYDKSHHSMPFFHPERALWIEVHRRLYPPHYPMANSRLSTLAAIEPFLVPVAVGTQTAYAMNHELQLVYTSARWSEKFDPEHGVLAMLDVALLLRRQGDTLQWKRVCEIVEESWAVTALRLMLDCIRHWDLAPVPFELRAWLVSHDRYANQASIALLRRLVGQYMMEGASFGSVWTGHNLAILWSTLMRPAPPAVNFMSLPYYLAFPPRRSERFSPAHALRRVRTMLRHRTRAL